MDVGVGVETSHFILHFSKAHISFLREVKLKWNTQLNIYILSLAVTFKITKKSQASLSY